jgi:8-oxo-dGTP diphosphatase
MNYVRISAKAVIILDGKLLVMHHFGSQGDYYLLPGGGQHNGENLITTVERECLEEAGVRVKVGDVLFIRDYIEANHEFAGERSGFHQVEIMFRCELIDGEGLGTGKVMDTRQVGVAWLPVDRLGDYIIYPKILKQVIGRDDNHPIYLGDVN